ncbi:hypothetical protein ACFX2C_009857 [Malus domestica]
MGSRIIQAGVLDSSTFSARNSSFFSHVRRQGYEEPSYRNVKTVSHARMEMSNVMSAMLENQVELMNKLGLTGKKTSSAAAPAIGLSSG